MEFEAFLEQWDLEPIPACEEGMRLLHQFWEKHPDSYAYLRPQDFVELNSPAFSGIPEWDAFAHHFATCRNCNEG